MDLPTCSSQTSEHSTANTSEGRSVKWRRIWRNCFPWRIGTGGWGASWTTNAFGKKIIIFTIASPIRNLHCRQSCSRKKETRIWSFCAESEGTPTAPTAQCSWTRCKKTDRGVNCSVVTPSTASTSPQSYPATSRSVSAPWRAEILSN